MLLTFHYRTSIAQPSEGHEGIRQEERRGRGEREGRGRGEGGERGERRDSGMNE